MKIVILGTPRAKQSARFTRNGIAYQTKRVKDYAKLVKYEIISQLPRGFKLFTQPLFIRYKFAFPYPRRTAKGLRGSDVWKATKPDFDNLLKSINDAMESVLFVNDSQICKANIEKVYSEIPRTDIEILEIN